MQSKKECVAMLLAGGQGSRLYALTTNIAKPAVAFGAKYRIIDFPLSNCVNSGIDTVGVLTQYQPLILNEYIGNGQPWDLDRNYGGVHILSPYQAKTNSSWYEGTANAIYQFEEKPKQPKSTLASMGIYIFSAKKLFKYLEEDDANPNSSKDFGKDVLPAMLNAGEKMFSYEFEGYWKDVGTIASLWQANMDLLGENPEFDVGDKSWKIHSRNPLAPPEHIGENGVVKNSMVALGCEIDGVVENSILGSNVIVEKGAVVKDAVVLANSVIRANATVSYSIIDENVTVGKNAKIGVEKNPTAEIVVLGRGLTVADGVTVNEGQKHEKDILA